MNRSITPKQISQSSNKLPSIFAYQVKDIDYLIPTLFNGGAKKEFTSIKNACNSSVCDEKGNVFIDSKYLDRVLRTKKFVVREIIQLMSDDEKVYSDGRTFVRLGEVMKFITKRLEKLPSGKTRNYLLLVEEFLLNIRDSDKFVNIRNEIASDYKLETTKLKNKRKRKLKNDGIKSFLDELTGKKLIRGSEFSHIRAKSVYPDLSLNIDNGLLVNKETHELITSLMIVTEDELLKLCNEQGWKTRWYKVFKNLVV